jgi:FKBP-type peptidyl-prolyl cis-trans isomerase FkpA
MDYFNTTFKRLSALFLTGLMLLYSGCFNSDEDDAAARLEQDLATIDQYLADHEIVAEQDPSNRIRYVIHTQTKGKQPTLDSCITAQYTGRFLDTGEVFTQSTRSSYTLKGDLIQGWKAAIPLLHMGEVATIYIPSGMAYGTSGLPLQNINIPPNAIVYFEFELINVGDRYSPTPSPTGSCN